jgi:hypothetical protein
LQHSEISFDGKIKEFKAKYQYIFWQFWDVPSFHGSRKFKIKHAFYKDYAMIMSTFVPSWISIEAFL